MEIAITRQQKVTACSCYLPVLTMCIQNEQIMEAYSGAKIYNQLN
jgi:hypothetical protein